MAFEVETGTASSTANSYVAVADADTYHADRGNTLWASLSTAQKQYALVRASDFLDSRFGHRIDGGYKVDEDQALEWPRIGFVDGDGFSIDSNVVPVPWKRACMEMALRAFDADVAAVDLEPDVARQEKRVKVGPIEVEWQDDSNDSTYYKLVEGLLADYIRSSNSVHLRRG